MLAADTSGRGDTNSSLQAQIRRSAQAAAGEDKAAAMPAAEPAFVQKLHGRYCPFLALHPQHAKFNDQQHKPANINRDAPCQVVMTTVELL